MGGGDVTEDSSDVEVFEGDLSDQLKQLSFENGTSSNLPPSGDTDDDDDGDHKPSDMYGKYSWKIEKFSRLNSREIRSNTFEVGGHEWHVLFYPSGCDVSDHLSLFLCVANKDTFLPGWSHLAQFTLSVVNKDPMKSKYTDTLHHFWKKEHDWGWKKFLEISKLSDGFLDADNIIIKAQVQVIRERADRPFRCLDGQYRRELVRVYSANVDQIFKRFVEAHQCKLKRLVEDGSRWSSFCDFWHGIDQKYRQSLCQEEAETILKALVKKLFIDKEVTSTLVMDSLYSGLRALKGQQTGKKDELPVPLVRMENEMFILVDDVLPLLERVATIGFLPTTDTKIYRGRTNDSIKHVESTLAELGRRTIEMFGFAHLFFNKIEGAYNEYVCLEMQEELIREEEKLARFRLASLSN